jgi:hypothetical protein
VRWVLSFHALPQDLVSLRDEVRFEGRRYAAPPRAGTRCRARSSRRPRRSVSCRRGTVVYEAVDPTPWCSGCPRRRDSS